MEPVWQRPRRSLRRPIDVGIANSDRILACESVGVGHEPHRCNSSRLWTTLGIAGRALFSHAPPRGPSAGGAIARFSPGGGGASIIVVRPSEVPPTIGRRRRLVLELKPPDSLRRPG